MCVFLSQEEHSEELEKDNKAEKPMQIVVTPAVSEEEEKEEEDDDDEFAFAKFSAMHFQRSATHTHIQQRLKHPLLYQEDERDTLVSLAFSFLSFQCNSPSFHR